MAVTYTNRKLDDQNQPYVGAGVGAGVSAAYGQQPQLASTKVPTYNPGQSVQNAKANLDSVMASKPGSYQSKYQPQLDSIMQQITNPQEFKYNFNDDELFKYYADLYTQKGKQASMDAMGQAAALTGGYGNSYAQSAGQQAYQQYLLGLYDKGMDMRDRAYQQFQDKRADTYNQYNVLNAAENQDYGRYRDTVSDWENERDYATNRYDTEYDRDYGLFSDDWNRQFSQDQADWDRYVSERDYTTAQQQYNQGVAQDYALAILANGQMPSDDMLAAAGLTRDDAMKLMAQLEAGGGSGGGGGGGGRGSGSGNGNNYDDVKASIEAAEAKTVKAPTYTKQVTQSSAKSTYSPTTLSLNNKNKKATQMTK